MRVRMLGSAAAAAVLAAALLTACVPGEPEPDPTPSGVFATEEEALAAAEEAYAAYLRVSDEIAQDGGENPERIEDVATGEVASSEIEGAKSSAEKGLRSIGSSTFYGFELDIAVLSYPAEVVAFTCLDVSGTRILDSTGVDVTPATRVAQVSLQVTFVSSDNSERLLVEKNDVWSASNLC